MTIKIYKTNDIPDYSYMRFVTNTVVIFEFVHITNKSCEYLRRGEMIMRINPYSKYKGLVFMANILEFNF